MKKFTLFFVASLFSALSFAALNPYAYGLSSELSLDESTLTVNYSLNADATGVNIVILNGETVVETITCDGKTKGSYTVEVPTTDFPKSTSLTWKMEVLGNSVATPTKETTTFKFYIPYSMDVDVDTESDYFGRWYVIEATNGGQGKDGYHSTSVGRGLYAFNAALEPIKNNSGTYGFTGGMTLGATETNEAGDYINLSCVTTSGGRVFVGRFRSGYAPILEATDLYSTGYPIVLSSAGGRAIALDAKGSGENLQLVMLGTDYSIKEYDLGTAASWTTPATPSRTINTTGLTIERKDAAITYDNEGGLWVNQNSASNPTIAHLSTSGLDYDNITAGLSHILGDAKYNIRGAAINQEGTELAVPAAGRGKVAVFTISKDSEGKISLTPKYTITTGNNNTALSYDYAGNLYIANRSVETISFYAMPYDGEVSTPAASKYAFQLTEVVPEVYTVTVEKVGEGTIEGGGEYLENSTVTLKATPAEHYEFTGWTGDVSSTDNPLKFTIEGDVNLTANFEAIPQVTITVTSNNEDMGTVTGGGTYDVGQEVTIAANPKATYRFVKWSDDVTDATRTFPAAEDLKLQAIFEKVPNRAWAYDLSQVADGDNYKFSFVATTAGEATLLFADKDGNELVAPYAVDTVAAGANTVTLAKTTFEGVTKDVYWSVKMDGEEIAAVAEITDQAKGIYDFYSMRGVVVDNDPNSTDFGKIYVEMSLNGASDGGSERTKTQTAGIFIYDQQLNELNTPSNKGYKPTMPSGYTELGTAAEAMKRLVINPTNGNLAFGNNISGQGSVWSVSRDNLIGTATNIIEGATGIDKVNAICYDEDGSLYVLANINLGSAKYNLYKFTDGVQTELTLGGEKIFVDPEVAMASDGRGGIWIAQNRSGIGQYKILSHLNVAEDKLDFVVETGKDYSDWFGGNCYRAAVAYNPNTNVLAVQGVNKVSLFSVSYDAAGVPSITKLVQTPTVGKNIDGLAFDYAGDLYVVNSSAEKLFKFTIPTAENICTVPAPASQKLVLGTQCEVTVTVNDPAMGSVEGAGQYEKGAEVTLKATPVAHHRFVDWTGDKSSTDNPLKFTIEGNVNLTANFEPIPQYTINVTYDNTMGTVTGDGTYYEGTEVTLTAKANGGYVFVKWGDEVTDESRTFTAGVDLPETLTATFKAAVPRAWAYDLRLDADTDPANYIFTFTATSDGNATILFTDKDGNTEAPNSYSVDRITAGEIKTVSIDKDLFTGTKDIYWSVKVEGEAIAKMAELTDPTEGIYDIVAPQGIAVDNNTNSDYFGQVYVAAATDGTVGRGAQTRGIFVYDQKLAELNTPNVGYLPANVTLTDATRHAIHRLAVNPINGYVAFAYNVSGSSAVWSMNPADMSGNAVNLIDGAGITKANSICFDENGILYVMDNANTGTGGKIYKIQNGVGDVFADAQAGNLWAVEENAMTPDGRGGLWIAQNRWSVDGYPVLSHVNSNGQVDFAVSKNSSAELQALFPYDDNNASYRGQCAYYVADDILAFAGNKEAVLFKITYDANDVPTNLEKLMSTGKLGTNIDGVAFDYAGDLYVASETTHRFYKFVVPTADNTCIVPAAESQAIEKEQKYTVTVEASPAEGGSVSGGGEAAAGAQVTVSATANTGYRFVNWTKEGVEVSTDASFDYTVPAENVTLTANFEALPEIAYELNGGQWNKYGWTSKKDMYNALMDDWRAYSGSTRTNVPYEDQLGIGKSKAGIPTTITSAEDRVALWNLFTDATYAPKWGWLATYVDAVATTQYKKMDAANGVKTQPTSAAGVFTFTIGNFFGEDKEWATGYIDAVDFTGAEAQPQAFQPTWGQSLPHPTQPRTAIVLGTPYKENYRFDGWYAAADFSGEEVTTVDQNTGGTIYAKWIAHFYTHTPNNKYGTICLPYASASTTGAYFYEVAGKEEGKVYLASVDALEAGVPYIFEKTASTITVYYTGEAVLAPQNDDANGLVGTFEEIEVPDGDYILYNDAFRTNEPGGTLNRIRANRAYLNMDGVTGSKPTPMPGRRYIGMDVEGENEATGLDNIQLPNANSQKLLINGQLIIIRDGEMYNAQGQKL